MSSNTLGNIPPSSSPQTLSLADEACKRPPLPSPLLPRRRGRASAHADVVNHTQRQCRSSLAKRGGIQRSPWVGRSSWCSPCYALQHNAAALKRIFACGFFGRAALSNNNNPGALFCALPFVLACLVVTSPFDAVAAKLRSASADAAVQDSSSNSSAVSADHGGASASSADVTIEAH